MKKKKEFDCVDVKNQIQKKILLECKGLTPRERHNKLQLEIIQDKEFYSIISRFKNKKIRHSV